MGRAFDHQQERDGTQQQQQQQHQQLKLCLPLVRLRSFGNPKPFCVLRFWVAKSLRNFYCRVNFSKGFCLRGFRYDGMVVNNTVFCASPIFLEEGKAAMEGLTERNDGIEDRNEENGGQIETFGDLIEEARRESSSSSDFLTSETTGHEEQSHSSSESSSPPSLGWPIQKAEIQDCTSTNGAEDEEKPHLGDRKLKKQVSAIPGFYSLSLSPLRHTYRHKQTK
jgi:hypothetical protein